MSKNCKQCRTEFFKESTCSLRRWNSTREFCSRNCLFAWRKGNPEYKAKLDLRGLAVGHSKGNTHGFKQGIALFSGEAHPQWKGGVSDFQNNVRKMPEYKIWRLSVYERDDFTCLECGERGGKLNADHIVPFWLILSVNNIDTFEKARECTDLWDTENGRTLCVPCHRKSPTWGLRALTYQLTS